MYFANVAPEDGGQSEVQILPPSKQFDCIAVTTCRLDFQPQFADAKNCQIKTGKNSRLSDAEGDPNPN